MILKIKINNIFDSHKKVIENYIFMTFLQILNTFFYFIIYPYLIRNLGVDNYGLYLFSVSFVTYFIVFISFGFDFPASSDISKNNDKLLVKSYIVSVVFTAKLYLLVISTAVYFSIVCFVPFLFKNLSLFAIAYIQLISPILLVQWYFQGVQKMKILACVQLLFKLLSLPLIFFYVRGRGDLLLFTLISSLSSLMSGITIAFFLIYKENLHIKFISLRCVYKYWKSSIPFFLSNSIGIVKQQSTTIIIGSFFNMADVAIFDLANKIVSMPIFLLNNIIGALFPKVAREQNVKYIIKIMKLILFISIITTLSIIIWGKLFIVWFAGSSLLKAYPITILLSFSIPSWLLVGSIISFLYVPKRLFKFVTYNQFLSASIYFIIILFGVLFYKNIYSIAIAVMVASVFEILYNFYLVKKNRLL